MSKQNKKSPSLKSIKTEESLTPGKVIMKFSTHQYYNDLDKPIFLAGKEYELEGADWIQRWLKRGGEIVSGSLPMPAQEPSAPSTIVPPGEQSGEPDGDIVENPESTGLTEDTEKPVATPKDK